MGCVLSKRPRSESASRAVAHCRDRSELLAEAIAARYALADAHAAYAASLSATGAALHDFLRAVRDSAPPSPDLGAGDASEEAAGDGADASSPDPQAMASTPVPASPDASEEDDNDDDDYDADVDDEASDDVGGGDDEAFHVGAEDDEGEADDFGGGDDEAEADPSLPRPEILQPVAPAPPTPQAPPQPSPQPLQTVPAYVPGYPPPPYSYGPAYGYGSYGGGYGADMAGYGHSVYNRYISYSRSQPPPPYVVEQRPHQFANDATVGYYHDDHHYQGEAVPTPSSQYGGYYSYPYPYMQGGGWSPVPAASGDLAAPLPATPSPPRAPTIWAFLDPFEGIESYQAQDDHPAAAPAAYASSRTSTDVSLEGEDLPGVDDGDLHKLKDDEGLPDLEDEESGVVVGDAPRHAGGERTCSCKSSDTEGSGCNPAEEGHTQIISSDGGVHEDGVEGQKENGVVEEQNDQGVAAEPAAVPEKTYTDVEVVEEIKAQFDTASKSAGDVCKMLEVGKVPYYKNSSSGFKVPSLVICAQRSKGKAIMKFEEEKAMECGNLSCTLQKLYMWEKKLLKEVKAMEKIRGLYEQKRKVQRKLYYNGADAHKLEAMEICVKNIRTKINISIDIVSSISVNINKLRDEELCPQTHRMIKGFMKMWHTMLECHHMQCHVFSHAKNIDSTMTATTFNEDHIYFIKRLQLQLVDMAESFSGWFNAQKNYATFLNEWLKRGIEYEPEVTDDGVPPFSPGRLGAPPIFSIYNNWAINIGRISDAEVVGTLQALAFKVLSIWGEKVGISSSTHAAKDSLQSCMTRVFEAMESFTSTCDNAYKDLHLHAKEDRAQHEGQENGRAPVADIASIGQQD